MCQLKGLSAGQTWIQPQVSQPEHSQRGAIVERQPDMGRRAWERERGTLTRHPGRGVRASRAKREPTREENQKQGVSVSRARAVFAVGVRSVWKR